MKNCTRFRWETFCINFFRVRWDFFTDWPAYLGIQVLYSRVLIGLTLHGWHAFTTTGVRLKQKFSFSNFCPGPGLSNGHERYHSTTAPATPKSVHYDTTDIHSFATERTLTALGANEKFGNHAFLVSGPKE